MLTLQEERSTADWPSSQQVWIPTEGTTESSILLKQQQNTYYFNRLWTLELA